MPDTLLTAVASPAFSPSVPALTTDSPAHPDSWNPTHQTLLNNDEYLRQSLGTVAQNVQQLGQQVSAVQLSSAVAVQRAVSLDWLYRSNKNAVELFLPSYTLIDLPPLAVQGAVAGDDSIDLAATAGLKAGAEYVIFDAVNRETVRVSTILNGNRIRVDAPLVNNYAAGATLGRTSFTVTDSRVSAVAGDAYLSPRINLGLDTASRAIVIRRTDNATNVRVLFRDMSRAAWTEVPWGWRRSGGPVPAGMVDVEYNVNTVGDTYLKLLVDGPCDIAHIVGEANATQLGGMHNPPIQPVNTSPAAGAAGLPERPTFTLASYASPVNSALAAVQFQLASAADGFGAPVIDSAAQPAGLSWQIPAGRLQVNTTYWMRGRVKDADSAWSAWSLPTSFTTAASFVYVVAPSNVAPAANASNVGAAPTLTSSALATTGGSDTHVSSQWQIRIATGSYAAPVWDSGEDATNKTSIVVPVAKLQAGQTLYYWRVRHKGTANGWSEWSQETSFTTQSTFGFIIGIACLSTGGGSGTWQRVDIDGNNKATDASYFNSHPVFGGVVDQTIDGQAMVKVPAFYYKVATIQQGPNAGRTAWWICDQPQPGFTLHPAFKNLGIASPQFWVGKYQAGWDGTKVTSIAGQPVMASVDFPTMQARCLARNTGGVTGFAMWSIYQFAAIQMLALIEMGGSDSQSLIGVGRINTVAGATVNNAADVAQATWRGIVGLWGNVRQAVDGLQTDANCKLQIWDRNGNRSWVTTSRVMPQVIQAFPVTMATDSAADYDLRDVFVPATLDNSAGNGTFADGFGTRDGGGHICHVGGFYSEGSAGGLFYLQLYFLPGIPADFHGTRLGKM